MSESSSKDSERIAAAKQRYDRIMKKIEPFVRHRDEETPRTRGVWRRGEDLPEETGERFRIESS